jgi:hypothetical protein
MSERSRFKLEKIKIVSGGGVSMKFKTTRVIGSDSYEDTEDLKSSKEAHPDLVDLFTKMRAMVGQIIGLTSIREVVNSPKFGGDKIQSKAIDSYIDEMLKKIKITGISISGKDKNKGVVITSTYQVDNKQVIALNTPRIMLSAESRGFEQDLENLVEEIENESFEFCFKNKVANPEMFDYKDAEGEEVNIAQDVEA